MKRYDLGWSEGDPFDGARSYPAIVEERNGDYVRWSDVERLTAERDKLRARVVELEAHELAVALAVGIAYEADGHAPAPGPCDQVLGEVERLRRDARDVYEYRERLAALESPPVAQAGVQR